MFVERAQSLGSFSRSPQKMTEGDKSTGQSKTARVPTSPT